MTTPPPESVRLTARSAQDATTAKRSYRVKRPLTADEISTILAGIPCATSTAELLDGTVRDLYTALLTGTGTQLADFNTEQQLRPGDYAIPTVQWNAIATALSNRAQEWGTSLQLSLDLVNVMPATYDDPDMPAPVVTTVDFRPGLHDLHITRDAVDLITAAETHLRDLGHYYGHQSPTYLTALASWHRHLAGLFSMRLGADTRIIRDGSRSLFVTTASGYIYGILFRGEPRRCTVNGCRATIRDDGTSYPPCSGVDEHDHQPSYPLGAPQPGEWTAHS